MPPPKKINHSLYDATKSKELHQFDKYTFTYILRAADVASKYKGTRALRTKKASEVVFHWNQYMRKAVCLSTPKYFSVAIGLCLRMMRQSCLKTQC